MRVSVVFYLPFGELDDPLLRAVLSGDLFEAVRRAGDANIKTLSNLAKFSQTAAPVGCDGSPERVNSWQERYDIVELNEVVPTA
jgi:hypothetical protein